MKREVKILNLCTEITADVRQYFESRKLSLIDPRKDESPHKWTHILTQDINDFGFIRETYQTIEDDIQIISLTPVSDKQNFVLANGKLCLEESWLKSDLRDFLFDKYFQDYLDSSLMTHNSVFQELGQFSIHQFFSFGDQLDQLTKAAFSSGVLGLAVKTYIDHIIMYVAALKSSAKMELPVEVAYGESDKTFGVQMYFSAQNLMLDDVSACLSLNNSRHAEETLLSTALNFCDFFDFSLVSNAQKVSVTALWLKEEEIEHSSFMLSWLPQKAKIVSYINDEVDFSKKDFQDPSDKIKLPKGEGSSEERREVSKESFSEVIAARISQTVELDKVKKIVGQELSDEDIYNLLEQSALDESKIIIGSEDELENVLQRVSGSFDELEVFKKDFFNENEVLDEVINSLRDNHSDIMKVKSLGENLSHNLKKSLENFCQEKMVVKGNLTREHIKEFQVHFLKNTLRKDSVILNSKGKELISDLKVRLERSLKAEFQDDDAIKVIGEALNNEADTLRVKSIFKNSLKESLEAKFEFSRNGTIDKEQESVIINSLSSSLGEDKEVIKEIVTNEEGVKPHRPLFASEVSEKEKALLVKLESLQQDKKALSDKLQATLMEIKVLKESKSTVSSIQSRASEVSGKETQQEYFDENIILKKEIQDKLVAGTLNTTDQVRLNELMEKELSLMTAVREEMMKFKKLQIESSQKEAMFSSELEKLSRQLKARDLILSKSKESMIKITEKKDSEIENLKNLLDQTQVNSQQENSNSFLLENKHLRVQNINLKKQMDVYKAKLSSLSSNLKKKEEDSSKDDLRKTLSEKVQLQNQLIKQSKEIQRSSSLLERELKVSKSLREEVSELKSLIADLEKRPSTAEVKEVISQNDGAAGASEVEVAQLAKIKSMENQITELELRLAEANKAQRSSGLDEKKMLHVEANLKKITQDLIESRNQTNEFKKENNKLRQEKTALQNQLDRMKKQTLKAKKAA